MPRILRVMILAMMVAVAWLVWCEPAGACPGCKEAVAGEGDEGQISQVGVAYSISVLFMLSMPFLLVSGFGAAFYVLHRKQQRLVHAEPAEPSAPAEEPEPAA